MNHTSGTGLQVIYDSAWPNEQPISDTNPQVLTVPFRLANASGCSVQIFSDGGAAYDFNFQVTNLPKNIIQYGSRVNGATMRDDAVNSPHWDTTPSGVNSVAATQGVTTLVFNSSIFREGRIIISRTSGTGSLFAILATAE